jgi:uncharacterized phage protein (TIGR01671 family)
MREILYRGKRTDDGEWIEGFYCPYSFGCFPCSPAIVSKDEMIKGCWRPEEVIPETIGQYTGLTDKNDKKIFEGDIVKYKNTDGIKFNGVGLTVIGKVIYNEKTASFAVYGKDKFGAKNYDYFPIKDVEIIGNIHDNLELPKEGEK